MDQGQIKNEFLGRDGFYWWIGQIPDEGVWKDNRTGRPTESNEDIKGFGERYKVRIMGSHLDAWESTSTPQEPDISDEDLPWATVMYPVTAGGGPGASYQSANLTQGMFVYGFYMDGENGQNPVIIGVLGYSEFNKVATTPGVFQPFSGFTESGDDLGKIPAFSVKLAPGGIYADDYEKTFDNVAQYWTEAATGNTSQLDLATEDETEDGKKKKPVAVPQDCKSGISGIQLQLQNIIQEVEKAKKTTSDYRYAISSNLADVQTFIDERIQEAAKLIAGGIKSILTLIEKEVIKRINDVAKKTYNLLMPNEQPAMKEGMEIASDLIACLFKKIIDALIGIIANFLKDLVNKAVNVPECLVDNFIGGLFGQLADLLNGAMNQAMNTINSVLDGIEGFVGEALSIAGDALSIISDVLSFLSCEERPECPTVDEWSIWDGANDGIVGDINSLIEKITSFADSAGNIANSFDIDNFDFSMDFDRLFDESSCSSGPRLCGPPTAKTNGPGIGALINLVVAQNGEIIAGDVVSSGYGYDPKTSYVRVIDDCGTGTGGVILPVFGGTDPDGNPIGPDGNILPPGSFTPDIRDPNGNPSVGIVDIIIADPGTGYLPTPNGSLGGDGRPWADPDDTIIIGPDGDYRPPIPPGVVVPVDPGDIVTTPPGSTTETFDGVVIGGGSPVTIETTTSFTTPPLDRSRNPQGLYPSLDVGKYPVILYLCDLIIRDSGINYQDGDEIIIEPNNGAVAVPKFDDLGQLKDIKITSQGEGFSERPTISIRSETGFNAVIIPKFCIDRIGENDLDKLTPKSQDKVISVVDCVGKF